MKNKKKLEFYAFIYDWNTKSVVYTNVLSMFEDKKELLKQMKFWKVTNKAEFKEHIIISLKSRFWGRAEYEVLVTDLFPRDYEDFQNQAVKIDVWFQLEKNIDIIVDLIIQHHNLEFK